MIEYPWINKPPLGVPLDESNLLTRDMEAYYAFNEYAGGEAKDLSGNGNNGQWNGTGTHWAGGVAQFASATSDYLDAGTDPSVEFGTSDFTFLAEIKPDAVADGSKAGIVSTLGVAAAGYIFAYRASGGNKLYIETYDGAQNPNGFSTGVITPNSWTQVAVVRGGGNYTFYINGTASGTVGDTAGNITNSNSLRIGGSVANGSKVFDGRFRYVNMLSRALSRSEVVALTANPWHLHVPLLVPFPVAAPVGVAFPILSGNDIHSAVFGRQIITGG